MSIIIIFMETHINKKQQLQQYWDCFMWETIFWSSQVPRHLPVGHHWSQHPWFAWEATGTSRHTSFCYVKYIIITQKIPHTGDTESLDRCRYYHHCHKEKKLNTETIFLFIFFCWNFFWRGSKKIVRCQQFFLLIFFFLSVWFFSFSSRGQIERGGVQKKMAVQPF